MDPKNQGRGWRWYRWGVTVAVLIVTLGLFGGSMSVAQTQGEVLLRDMNSLMRDLQLTARALARGFEPAGRPGGQRIHGRGGE